MMGKIITIQQVAELLQVPLSSIYERTRRRGSTAQRPPIPFRRCGKYLRFIDTEVLAWFHSIPSNTHPERRHGKVANEADIAKVRERLGDANISTMHLYDRRKTRPRTALHFM